MLYVKRSEDVSIKWIMKETLLMEISAEVKKSESWSLSYRKVIIRNESKKCPAMVCIFRIEE